VTKGLTPWMEQKVADLLAYGRSIGIEARVSEGFRTCARQNAIYAGGSSTATGVSGCHSWHVWGRAADLLIDGGTRADYAALAAEWKRWGGIWGGDWTSPADDWGHFEWHPDIPDIHDLCPRGAGAEACPDPNEPWPEDRPLWARPGVRLLGGALLAAGGMYLAYSLVRR